MTAPTLDLTKPDPATQGITAFGQSTRDNLQALRDAVVAGNLPGFNYSWSGGTIDQPTNVLRTKSAEVIKSAITWGTNGSPSSVAYSYSTNGSTGSFSAIGTCTFSWDGDGYLQSTTWS